MHLGSSPVPPPPPPPPLLPPPPPPPAPGLPLSQHGPGLIGRRQSRMRNFNWETLPKHSVIGKHNIWTADKTDGGYELDTDDIEELFSHNHGQQQPKGRNRQSLRGQLPSGHGEMVRKFTLIANSDLNSNPNGLHYNVRCFTVKCWCTNIVFRKCIEDKHLNNLHPPPFKMYNSSCCFHFFGNWQLIPGSSSWYTTYKFCFENKNHSWKLFISLQYFKNNNVLLEL